MGAGNPNAAESSPGAIDLVGAKRKSDVWEV
jgi:hypothetical protein